MGRYTALVVLLLAAGVYAAVTLSPWHPDPRVRLGAALASLALVLWISEAAPLGVTALLIPVVASFSGLLTWDAALLAWGDPVVFLFLASFLLVRALEKHGALEIAGSLGRFASGGRDARAQAAILGVSGLLSTVQNNTAVTAGLLPAVAAVARRLAFPSLALLALSYGATFGGLATPVGTAPNFIGYAEMKKLSDDVTFVSWLAVGLPAWLGTSAIALGVMVVAARLIAPAKPAHHAGTERARPADAAPRAGARARGSGVGARGDGAGARGEGDSAPGLCAGAPDEGAGDASQGTAARGVDTRAWDEGAGARGEGAGAPGGGAGDPDTAAPAFSASATRAARRWAVAAMLATAATWLTTGLIIGLTAPDHPAAVWVKRYLPESLAPTLAAAVLFFVRVGPGRPVLERRDLHGLDWDTLFLIAGGLCLGKSLEASGAARALAESVQALHLHPVLLTFALGAMTVLLSELTSNTATANIFIRLAAPLAPALELSPTATVWLVSLCASLGFALPVSTPPNAIVYGTRLVPLRHMIAIGLVVDALTLTWIVACIRALA